MAIEKNLQLVLDKDSEFADLDKRMDDDRLAYLLDPYIMRNIDGQPTPDVINVTMNDAKVFADRCAAIMSGANMQPEVFGKDLNDKETSVIENFLDDIYISNDELLANTMFCSLYGFTIENINVRGSISTRCLMREEDERFIPDIMPVDTRYFRYDVDMSGLIWSCPKVWYTKAQVERQFKAEELSTVSLRQKVQVYDFWDKEVNQIFINKKLVKTVEHGLGYVPFVYQKSGAGTMLQDEGHLKYTGESIFASNRGLMPELHRAASIMQTLSALSFQNALVLNRQEPGGDEKPENPYGLRKVIELGPNEGYKPVPIQDANNATRLFYAMLVGALQRGALPNIDYGNLTFPLSAVAISRLTASRDAIFIPRLQAMAMFYRSLSKMIAKQYVQGGYKVPIGTMGKEREYATSDIDKPFGVQYKFYSTSPEQDIANYAVAQQASPFVDDDTIRRDILKLRNPDAVMDKMRAERAEKGDMAISLFRLMHSLIDEGEKDPTKYIEAEMVLQQLELVLRNRAMGQPMGMSPLSGGAGATNFPKPLVPLLAGGGGSSPNPTQEETMAPEQITTQDQNRAETVRKQTEQG